MVDRSVIRTEEVVRICHISELVEAGAGVRFPVIRRGVPARNPLTGFVVRFQGKIYGYLNECAHVPSELDWIPGQFFDHSGLYLICSTHGALYEPENGRCVAGPCRSGRLRPIDIVERGQEIYWCADDCLEAPPSYPTKT